MKDKILIYLLKIKRFVLKNKISVGIGVLLLITGIIVYRVVFADIDPYAGNISIDTAIFKSKSTGTAPFDSTETNECSVITNGGCDENSTNKWVRTFDTFDISIQYNMVTSQPGVPESSIRDVIYKVTFPVETETNPAVNVTPLMLDDNMTYTYDEISNIYLITTKQTLTQKTTVVSDTVKFLVGGNKYDTDITPEIEIYESTVSEPENNAATVSGLTAGSIITTSKNSVEMKVIGNYAYKKAENIRSVPFGIVVKLKGIGIQAKGIKGAMYPENITLIYDFASEVGISYDSVGIYEAQEEWFNLPNGIIEGNYSSENAAYNSGTVDKISAEKQIVISGIDSNGIFPSGYENLDETDENIVGTYYIKFNSLRTNQYDREITFTMLDQNPAGEVTWGLVTLNNSATVIDRYVSDGTEEGTTATQLEVKDEDNINVVNSITKSETITMSAKSVYGKSADPITNATITQTVIIPANMLITKYGSNVGDEYFDFYSNVEGISKTDFSIKAYTSSTYNGVYVEVTKAEGDTSVFDTLLDKVNIATSYTKIEFSTTKSIESNTQLNFYIKAKLNGASAPTNAESNKYVFRSSFSVNELFNLNGSQSLNYTGFKARTDIEIDGSEGNSDYSSSYSKPLKWIVSPTVSSYGENNTITLKNIEVVAYISSGLDYSSNSSYDTPVVEEGSGDYAGYKKLTYTLTGQHTNDYIQQLMFDTYIKLDASNEQKVIVIISATDAEDKTDESTVEERTTTKSIYVFGSSSVMFRQIALTPEVRYQSGELELNYKTEVRNGLSETVNTAAINVVPNIGGYLDTTSIKINDVEVTNAVCTTQEFSSTDMITISQATFDNCSNYDEESEMEEITAFKVNFEVNSQQTIDVEYVVVPKFPEQENPSSGQWSYSYTTFAGISYHEDGESATPYEITNFATTRIVPDSISLSGKIWEDFSYDGQRDETERELSNISLKICDATDVCSPNETVSDENGNYMFYNLVAGRTYYVIARYDTEKYFPTKVVEEFSPEEKSVFTSETINEIVVAKSALFTVTEDGTENVNLGLALKKIFALSINKYISKVVVKSPLSLDKVYEYNKTKTVKIDVKDMSKVSIKVVYTLELENIKYYPGYALKVVDYIPYGMAFNNEYDENSGWSLDSNGFLINENLKNTLIYGGEKKYLTIAFDITSKEAGEFVNSASVYDLQPLTLGTEE